MKSVILYLAISLAMVLIAKEDANNIQSSGNKCETNHTEKCGGCQIDCPDDQIAYCSDGIEGDVRDMFGHYVKVCKKQPICNCKK
jgi:hypothetical protein